MLTKISIKKLILFSFVLTFLLLGLLISGQSVKAGHPDTLSWQINEVFKTEDVDYIINTEQYGVNNSSGLISYRSLGGENKIYEIPTIDNHPYPFQYRPLTVYINEKFIGNNLGALVGLHVKELKVERRSSRLLFGGLAGSVYSDSWYIYVAIRENSNSGSNINTGKQNLAKFEGFIKDINTDENLIIISRENNNKTFYISASAQVILNGQIVDYTDIIVGDKVEKVLYDFSNNYVVKILLKRE